MSTRQLLVGDVVLLEAGDKIPADGVLTQGDDVTVNESSLTGEAEDVRKAAAVSGQAEEEGGEDVFMLSGCTLTSGRATMMVIAVGAESRWGRIKVRATPTNRSIVSREALSLFATSFGTSTVCAYRCVLWSVKRFQSIFLPSARRWVSRCRGFACAFAGEASGGTG